jgi:hypothetical protein
MLHAAFMQVPRPFTDVRNCRHPAHGFRGTTWNNNLSTSLAPYSQSADNICGKEKPSGLEISNLEFEIQCIEAS